MDSKIRTKRWMEFKIPVFPNKAIYIIWLRYPLSTPEGGERWRIPQKFLKIYWAILIQLVLITNHAYISLFARTARKHWLISNWLAICTRLFLVNSDLARKVYPTANYQCGHSILTLPLIPCLILLSHFLHFPVFPFLQFPLPLQNISRFTLNSWLSDLRSVVARCPW